MVISPERGGVDAEQHSGQFRPAAAHQPGQAEDLARLQGERDIVHPRWGVEVLGFEQYLAERLVAAFPVGHLGAELLADDALHDLRRGDVGEPFGEQPVSVAQDGDPIRDPVHLVHPVRDVDDRDAPRLQPVDQLEQCLGLVPGEAGRRLVHDQHLGVLGQRLRDLGELPVRGARAH